MRSVYVRNLTSDLGRSRILKAALPLAYSAKQRNFLSYSIQMGILFIRRFHSVQLHTQIGVLCWCYKCIKEILSTCWFSSTVVVAVHSTQIATKLCESTYIYLSIIYYIYLHSSYIYLHIYIIVQIVYKCV